MNKAESKYFNTALLMNQALIELLNKKEFEFITIKEICHKAGVNRSTFYLHYDNTFDLLDECIENISKKFFDSFNKSQKDFFEKLKNSSKENLVFITPEYLTPYLKFIKDNKTIHQVFVNKHKTMNTTNIFNQMNKEIFSPIFDKFEVEKNAQNYIIMYYLNGINAIINEWIKNNCLDDIEYIEKIIIDCVRPNL